LKENINTYGNEPFQLAVLHGGPGAMGYMAPVALEMSKKYGVLEPLQSKLTVQEQIDELKGQIIKYTNKPIVLVGSSWGAILALLFASQNQYMVEKLVLVGCGTFTKESSDIVDKIRNSRLTKVQQKRIEKLIQTMDKLSGEEQSLAMKEFGAIFDSSDKYYPICDNKELGTLDWNIFINVWKDFVKLRNKPNYIKSEFSKINIPAILIQGDYDPHLTKEVYSFLKKCIPKIKLYELEKCGHYPWIEKYAKNNFYKILKDAI